MPRPFLGSFVSPAWRRRLQRVQHPLLTLPLWVASTIVWLLPDVHHAVLENNGLWLVQQGSFLVTGLLLWGPVVERIEAPRWFGTAWKGAYMTMVWTVGLLVANLYWFSGTVFYSSHADAARTLGFDPLQDQANAGTVMMLSHCLLAFGAVGVLFFRQAREGELRQRLLEAGVDADRIERATREGTAAALAEHVGVSARTRAGID
jgi:putative copper resistance protein D